MAGPYRTFYISAGMGEPLLLLHGAGGDSSIFQHTIAQLARNHTVIAPDIIGHGRTEGPTVGYSESLYSYWLDGFLSAIGLEAADLVGHSLGGAIALRFAYNHPEQVIHLVLVNTISLGFPSLLATLYLLLAMFSPRKQLALDLVGRVMFSGPKRNRREMTARFLSTNDSIPKGIRGFLWMLARTWGVSWPAPRRMLRGLRAPVLLVWGEADRYIPLSHARRGVRFIPHSQLSLIPKAGHAPFLERPEEFNDLLLSYLAAE